MLEYINYEEVFEELPGGQAKLARKTLTAHEKIGKVDYMIHFNRTETFKLFDDILPRFGKVIYENNYGRIIKFDKKGN